MCIRDSLKAGGIGCDNGIKVKGELFLKVGLIGYPAYPAADRYYGIYRTDYSKHDDKKSDNKVGYLLCKPFVAVFGNIDNDDLVLLDLARILRQCLLYSCLLYTS